MRAERLVQPSHHVHIRAGTLADLDVLCQLENKVFVSDRMSRRSLRRLLAAKTASPLVAQDEHGAVAGAAMVLFRQNSKTARLYSIAVSPQHAGRGIAKALIASAEQEARSRGCRVLRLEVHENNAGAIALYRKTGFIEFGRHHEYYRDRGHALRLEKVLDTRALPNGACG